MMADVARRMAKRLALAVPAAPARSSRRSALSWVQDSRCRVPITSSCRCLR